MGNNLIFMKGQELSFLLIYSLSIVKWILCLLENRCVFASWNDFLPFFLWDDYLGGGGVFWFANFGASHFMHIDSQKQKQLLIWALPKYLPQPSILLKEIVFPLRKDGEWGDRECDGNSCFHLSLVNLNIGFLANKLQNPVYCS